MSRGAKVTLGTILVLVIVLVLGYGVDRYAAHRVEQSISDELTTAAAGQGVHTEITGGMFFPQVISGSLDEIRVQADQVQLQDLVITDVTGTGTGRAEEHKSELQSRGHLVGPLLLEKKE